MQPKQDGLYIPDQRECMTCGFCIPRCPTFKVLRDEAESPRGRLRLLGRLLNEQATLTQDEFEHLDNCLQCRACETTCPSKVPYGQLLDKALPAIARETRFGLKRRLISNCVPAVLSRRRLRRGLTKLLRLYQRSGLRALFQWSGILRAFRMRRLDGVLPPLPPQGRWKPVYPATAPFRGAIGLFVVCISEACDSGTLNAAIRLLNRLGYDVHVPASQGCCGALHLHDGQPAKAAAFAKANIAAFSGTGLEAIVHIASGCGLMLAGYDQLETLRGSEETARFTGKLQDISAFLTAIDWPEDVSLEPLNQTVAVHEPCSQRNGLGAHEKPYALLERIPGIRLVALEDNGICCGAAGTHMLTHPHIAVPLRDEKLRALHASQPDILVTSNIGCALHLAAGLVEQDLSTPVLHPVALIERQLPR